MMNGGGVIVARIANVSVRRGGVAADLHIGEPGGGPVDTRHA